MASRPKPAEVYDLAVEAISARVGESGMDGADCILNMWVEPDGTVVLHVNSGGNAGAAVHALWRRFTVDSAIHPEFGVLVWAE